MSAADIDGYLDGLEEPKRSTLEKMRQTILELLPGAEQGISYSMPVFKKDGKPIAGLAAFKNHLAYLPHSGSVLSQLEDELRGYRMTPGSLHFPVDKPLPKALVKKLIDAKLRLLKS